MDSINEKLVISLNEYVDTMNVCRHGDACAALELNSEKGQAYDRAIALKDIIKGIQTGEFEITELQELISEGIESRYSLSATNDAMLKKEYDNIHRYLSCEKRTAEFGPVLQIPVNDSIAVKVKPDAIFVKKDLNTLEVEGVFYKAGNPTINQRTGIKADAKTKNIIEWFKLWMLCKYLNVWVSCNKKTLGLQKGEPYYVTASFYYMCKSTDSKIPRDMDFFSGKGGNICSLIQKKTFGINTNQEETYDKIFEDFILQREIGVECSEDDCKNCMSKANCRYTKAPVSMTKKTTSIRKKIKLSDEQKKIVEFTHGCAKVNATAGSGKTECMTERSKRLIASGVKPSEILHISFTDAAVKEMKARIAGKCLGEKININENDICSYTFNGFANLAIGAFYQELGYTAPPKILTAEFELDKIEKICESVGTIPDADMKSVKYIGNNVIPTVILNCQKVFSKIKELNLDPNASDIIDKLRIGLKDSGVLSNLSDNTLDTFVNMYKDYDKSLKIDNLVTFADQEPLMYKVLELHLDYFENLGYKHIVVDEFQDSNTVQMDTIKLLTDCKCFESLMVVGDDSQAIYSFRNTTPEYIINFEKYLGKPVEELFLSENRRSTPEIIELANKVNSLNINKIEKTMIATRESGESVHVNGFYDTKSENVAIVNEIKRLINEKGYAPEDIAYIASKKTQLAAMGTLLSEAGIPWIMKNPMNLMENSRVIGALSLADAFYDPDSTVYYFNYLVAKYDGEIFEKHSVEDIKEEIAQMQNVFANIYMLEFEQQKRIFHEYLELIRKDVKDELYDYFLELLYANEDLPSELEYTRIFKKYGSQMAKKMDQSYEGVVLTTCHSSKGLEWSVVFASISEFDSEKNGFHKRNSKGIEEMRRLLFVTITRARDILYLSGKYVAYGPKNDRTYNMFLKELYEIVGKDYQPIDPMEKVKEEEARVLRNAKARERNARKRTEKMLHNNEMSSERKAQYNRLTKNAKQINVDDIIAAYSSIK